MKIRKKETSIGIVGKILNAFSSSKQDTYSADYINTAIEEHYSTEETFTGKYWIDGKKIYRKVLSKNSIEVGVNASIPIVDHSTVDSIVDLRGVYNDGAGTIRIYPLTQNTGTVLNCVYYQGNIGFVGNETYSQHGNRFHTFILEYTKK